MASPRTADFELIIGDTPVPGAPPATRHPVQVTSPDGPGTGVLDFNPDPAVDPLVNLLSSASSDAPDPELRKQAGRELFGRLFRNDPAQGWDVAERWAGSVGRRKGGAFDVLRVRLWVRNPALAALPWELLCTDSGFLATDAAVTLSRYLPGPEPSYLDPVPAVRVLAVVCRPTKGNFPPIPDEAVAELEAMFGALAPRVKYTLLRDPDLAAIQAKLADGYHVLHYLGHGVPNELIFTRADGSPQRVGVENLRQIMIGRRTLRAVILNACGSGQSGVNDVFAGVGPGIVQVGVPAALAMQYDSVYLDVATKFNETFYDRLAKGNPIDVCVTEGRQAVSATDVADRGWSTPVLYVGTRGGRVIELADGPVPPVHETHPAPSRVRKHHVSLKTIESDRDVEDPR